MKQTAHVLFQNFECPIFRFLGIISHYLIFFRLHVHSRTQFLHNFVIPRNYQRRVNNEILSGVGFRITLVRHFEKTKFMNSRGRVVAANWLPPLSNTTH